MSKKSITTRGSVTKRTLALVLAIAAAGVVATGGSATSTERSGALHVTKQCSDPPYDGTVGSFCTITSSNIPAIEPGMRVVYLATPGSGVLDSDLALGFGQGSALGHVVLDLTKTPPSGRITFSAGTGKFSRFRADAAVSVDGAGVWHWDGRYRFG
jgi:hypothetical protein